MTARRVLAWIIRVAGVLIVADLIADRRGFTLLDPFFFIPFACLSATIVGPILTARPDRITRAVLHACAIPAVILLLSLTLLNLAAPPGIWVFPGWALILEASVCSLAAAAAAAALAAFLLPRISPVAVKWGFRGATLAAILAYRWWPTGIQ